MMVMFFTLLNFFLAIIVDAFADVKRNNEQLKTVHSFGGDVADLMWTKFQSYMHSWPKRNDLNEFFKAYIAAEDTSKIKALKCGKHKPASSKKPICHPEDLMNAFPKHFPTQLAAAQLLSHYNLKCEEILCHRHDDDCEHGGSRASEVIGGAMPAGILPKADEGSTASPSASPGAAKPYIHTV